MRNLVLATSLIFAGALVSVHPQEMAKETAKETTQKKKKKKNAKCSMCKMKKHKAKGKTSIRHFLTMAIKKGSLTVKMTTNGISLEISSDDKAKASEIQKIGQIIKLLSELKQE